MLYPRDIQTYALSEVTSRDDSTYCAPPVHENPIGQGSQVSESVAKVPIAHGVVNPFMQIHPG